MNMDDEQIEPIKGGSQKTTEDSESDQEEKDITSLEQLKENDRIRMDITEVTLKVKEQTVEDAKDESTTNTSPAKKVTL